MGNVVDGIVITSSAGMLTLNILWGSGRGSLSYKVLLQLMSIAMVT